MQTTKRKRSGESESDAVVQNSKRKKNDDNRIITRSSRKGKKPVDTTITNVEAPKENNDQRPNARSSNRDFNVRNANKNSKNSSDSLPPRQRCTEEDNSLNVELVPMTLYNVNDAITSTRPQNGQIVVSSKIVDPPGYPVTPGNKKLRGRSYYSANSNSEDSAPGLVQNNTSLPSPLEEEHEGSRTKYDSGDEIELEDGAGTSEPDFYKFSWVNFFKRLCVIAATISIYYSHITSQVIDKSVKSELLEVQIRVQSLLTELDETRHDNMECKNKLQTAQLKNDHLDTDVSFLKHRLESMINTEDSIQVSLSNSWATMDKLRNENHQISSLLNSSKAQLSIEKEAKIAIEAEYKLCSNRVVELEFSVIEGDDQIEECRVEGEKLNEEKTQIEIKLGEQHDLVALLQHQLDEENGHTWYYELQMKYLDDLNEDFEGTISDLKYENIAMEKEIIRLRNQILTQNDEAVAALNAVATSATYRKAEQFALVESHADDRVEYAKSEAVKAVNSVMSAMMTKT